MPPFQNDTTARRLQRAVRAIRNAGHSMMTVAELDRLLTMATGDDQPRNADVITDERMLVLRGVATRAPAGALLPTVSTKLTIFEALMAMEGRGGDPTAGAERAA